MKTPAPLRFTCDIKTLTVTDTQTNKVIQCADVMEMGRVRRDLELQSKPVKQSTGRRVKEAW